jgi:hypothetical protein
MKMKVAVINFSGNVGKSTVARHLLLPRMKKASVFAVESINSDGTEDEAVRGKQFAELLESLALVDNAVIDVGASNVEDFVTLMGKYRGSHEDFDYYVVPTVAKHKQQTDTISTIKALSELGVPANKLRLVFNMVETDETIERQFTGILSYHVDKKNFILNRDAVIHMNEIYGKLKNTDKSIGDILNDPDDLKEKLKKATTTDEKIELTKKIAVKRLAAGVTEELDAVFKTLFK